MTNTEDIIIAHGNLIIDKDRIIAAKVSKLSEMKLLEYAISHLHAEGVKFLSLSETRKIITGVMVDYAHGNFLDIELKPIIINGIAIIVGYDGELQKDTGIFSDFMYWTGERTRVLRQYKSSSVTRKQARQYAEETIIKDMGGNK